MEQTDFYLAKIEEYIRKYPMQGEPDELYTPARYMMSLGGKRLRPIMVLMGCEAVNGNYKDALPAALAIEILHNFTLVHDDIMDAAPLRRGKPTVHALWNIPTAILTGDMMMFRSVMHLQQLNPAILNPALDLFNQTAIDVCEGQQMDMLFEQKDDVSISAYLDMISRKTSALLGCSFSLGALCGGADKNLCDTFYNFGKNLGIAFQLHDDILDAFAPDNANFGKQLGGDIIANKKTYLLLKALEFSKGAEHDELKSLIRTKLFDAEEKIRKVKEIYISTGARDMAEEEKHNYYNKALNALESSGIEKSKHDAMLDFARMVMERKN